MSTAVIPASKETNIPKPHSSPVSTALKLGSYFVSGVLAVNISQFLGGPLYLVNKDWYNTWIAFTKQSFGLLITTMTQQFAPTIVRVSGDKSVRGQLMRTPDGNLLCDFPSRAVMIANHQIYTDWLYLWWIAYTNAMHGHLFIVLKESLKRIPVIGWGMQLSQFIFLKRNWEKDKPRLSSHLQQLDNPSDPMWLLLFPEGTNLAPSTRMKSKKWASKNGVKDMEHTLLPRSTGLQFCLQQLRRSVDYLYDCTIAYEGVPRGQYAQNIYSLKSQYLEGTPPKSVNMYWRRYKISSIPLDDSKRFEAWLRTRWREKDMLIERFYCKGKFPPNITPDGNSAGHIETQIQSKYWHEFLQVFAPLGMLALVLYSFYGALPKVLMDAVKERADEEKVTAVQRHHIQAPEAKMILGSHAEALVRKVEAARQTKFSPEEQKLLRGPAGQGVLQQLAQQHQAKITQDSRPKSVQSENTASEKSSAVRTGVVSAARQVSKSAPAIAAAVGSYSAIKPSIGTGAPSASTASAPSVVSVPTRKAADASIPNRSLSAEAPVFRKTAALTRTRSVATKLAESPTAAPSVVSSKVSNASKSQPQVTQKRVEPDIKTQEKIREAMAQARQKPSSPPIKRSPTRKQNVSASKTTANRPDLSKLSAASSAKQRPLTQSKSAIKLTQRESITPSLNTSVVKPTPAKSTAKAPHTTIASKSHQPAKSKEMPPNQKGRAPVLPTVSPNVNRGKMATTPAKRKLKK